ncbi:helix-turn-helix domain-containing protein [Paenibacillus thermoaerophilus]|uniref:Helix-turn-helix domain-containing protein n=1 Tax=Paenibacillus thermoaerophilus TaxID=1215385 RepID=A0ABW2V437_9BACL|nr:AraC family transcriptional regulator [Paenibacillus thermoaerophilus]
MMTQDPRKDADPGVLHYAYRVRTPASYWFHAHQGIELLYVYEGQGEIMLDNRTYPLSAGTLVWFQPYQMHRVEAPLHAELQYTRTILTFDPHFLEPYLGPFPELRSYFYWLWKGNLPQQVFAVAEDNPLPGLLDELHEAVADGLEGTEEDHALLLLRLIRLLKRRVMPAAPADGSDSRRVQRYMESMQEWLERNFHLPFSLEAMASDLHLSPYHVSHLFKKSTGMTISRYLTLRRIREACSLLANTSKSVREIAWETGRLNSAYFCKIFKEHKGMSPENYRKAFRQSRNG